jgi:uncharacterized membrane protein
MSTRPARSDAPHRALDASGVLLATAAILLLVAYPFAVREALRLTDGESWMMALLVKLPPIAIDGALAWAFLSSLARGREPVIARFARLERGALEPDLAAYARRLTAVWGGLFIAMGVACAALSTPATTLAWQWWTSLGSSACVIALFVGERYYRKRRFAHYAHASLARQLSIVIRHWRSQ